MPHQACVCFVADCTDLKARISVSSTMRPINEIFHFWWRPVLSHIVQLLYVRGQVTHEVGLGIVTKGEVPSLLEIEPCCANEKRRPWDLDFS